MILCHDPSDCLTYSNCTGVTDCEPYQGRLDILDTIVFNKFLQKKCSIFTCCRKVCPDMGTPLFPPTGSPGFPSIPPLNDNEYKDTQQTHLVFR